MLVSQDKVLGSKGGRPQIIEMGLDRADRPQTRYSSWFVELKRVKRQQIISKPPCGFNAPAVKSADMIVNGM